ncbi:MAG: aspartyl protease family protein [Proteobacteria bacterium]|nr:aspartyl protease family protein [Pseudomonadota bacterium]
MSGTRPIVHAQINGADAALIADSGAFFNSMTSAAAARFKLPLRMAPMGFSVSGVGGDRSADLTTVKEFTFAGAKLANVDFVVVGNDSGGAVGLLGQNILSMRDTEYDLANGVIRIMREKECRGQGLAYWSRSAPASEIDIERISPPQMHILGDVYVNGVKVRAMFDTGSASSVLSLAAAKRAGITPTTEGVKAAGTGVGLGSHYVQKWIAPIPSFKIGDEEIRDTHMYIADIGTERISEMLLGADFFLAHHLYVSRDRGKLYFTYNGGQVFNLGHPQDQQEAIVVASGHAVAGDAEPVDAAGFSRRAAAASARGDYASAAADLDRACALEPTEARYFYERGMAHWAGRKPDLALADFDAALKLKPDHVPALMARARMHAKTDVAAATADLEAADRALPQEAAERLDIGSLYSSIDALPAALAQYSKWIDHHERTDVLMAAALNDRCYTRALLNQDVSAALSDCNAALKLQPKTSAHLDSRGLAYLRLGQYDKAVADFDAALVLAPKNASSRFCRGIAKIRQGHPAEGQTDISAATAQFPKVGERFARYGLVP